MPDRRLSLPQLAILAALPALGGCGEFLANQLASRGGDTAGDQGSYQVVFINNTPHEVVFTAGAYDRTDQSSVPRILRFGGEDGTDALAGDGQTDIQSLPCGRVFAIGTAELGAFVEQNGARDGSNSAIEDPVVEDTEFFSTDEDDPDAGPTSAGIAPPFEALLGVDFSCNSLVIIRFEFDDFPGNDPFRITLETIPSDSTR